MKKIIILITSILCIPIMLLTGCSTKKSKLNKINVSAYFNETTSYSTFETTGEKSLPLNTFLKEEPDTKLADSFVQIKLKAISAMIYKMYIDCIYFYVYTNIETDSQMMINVTITNLANENNIENPTDDFAYSCSFIPKENGAILCTVPVKKVVATATGLNLSFDIFETTDVFKDGLGNNTGFNWIIYGLTIHGESRAYSK